MLDSHTGALPLLSRLSPRVYQQPATVCYRHEGTIGAHKIVAPIPLHRRVLHEGRAVLGTSPNDIGCRLDVGQRIRWPLSTSSVGCCRPAPEDFPRRHKSQTLSVRPSLRSVVPAPLTVVHSDHDELKYSIRSVLQHFGGHTSRFHLVTTDMPHPDGRSPFRLGLIPQWLDPEATDHWKHGHINLALQHHSQVFINPGLPSFNR